MFKKLQALALPRSRVTINEATGYIYVLKPILGTRYQSMQGFSVNYSSISRGVAEQRLV